MVFEDPKDARVKAYAVDGEQWLQVPVVTYELDWFDA